VRQPRNGLESTGIFSLNGMRVGGERNLRSSRRSGCPAWLADELNGVRVEQLEEIGSNAIRTSHNAPTLPNCLDRATGSEVGDYENREYGINPRT